MLQKNDLTDVIMEPPTTVRGLKLESMSEEATRRFESYLGTDDADALILGYVVVPKKYEYDTEIQDTVREFASITFGEDVPFSLCPIHPHDSLSEAMQSKMRFLKEHVNYLYCVIYLPPEKSKLYFDNNVGKTSPL